MKYLTILLFAIQTTSCSLLTSDRHEVLVQEILNDPKCDFQQNLNILDSLSKDKKYRSKIETTDFRNTLIKIREDVNFYNDFKEKETIYEKLSAIIIQSQRDNQNIEVKAIEAEYNSFVEKILSDLIDFTKKSHENNDELGNSVKKVMEYMGKPPYSIQRMQASGILGFAGLNTKEQLYFADNFGVPDIGNGNLGTIIKKYSTFIDDFRNKFKKSRQNFIKLVEANLIKEEDRLKNDANYLKTKEELVRKKLCEFRALISGSENDYARYQYKVDDLDFISVRNRLVPDFYQYKVDNYDTEINNFKTKLSELSQKYKNSNLSEFEITNNIFQAISLIIPKDNKIIAYQPISCKTANLFGSNSKITTVMCVNTFEIDSKSGNIVNHFYDIITNENDKKYIFDN
jgi:hypothetical protein